MLKNEIKSSCFGVFERKTIMKNSKSIYNMRFSVMLIGKEWLKKSKLSMSFSYIINIPINITNNDIINIINKLNQILWILC